MAKKNFSQGGDAQAISEIAKSYYGSYRNMFSNHNWDVAGDKMMTSAPKLIKDTYGSILRFVELHEPTGDLMSPMAAIYSDPPNVWFTSLWGFEPEQWGFFGFTDKSARDRFLKETKPGVLVVVYLTGRAYEAAQKRHVVGIMQCSHEIGHSREMMPKSLWDRKEADPETKGKWDYAVRVERAWHIDQEDWQFVESFSPSSAIAGDWESIGAQGKRLPNGEAKKILNFEIQEANVYGGQPIFDATSDTARKILSPSKAGPVSQTSFTVKESEGPKHLYILLLEGNADNFLGRTVGEKLIVKAGFSKDPRSRLRALNSALPDGAFKWSILHSGIDSGFAAYPSSQEALVGERKMQDVMCENTNGESLGGEFFLAPLSLITKAWQEGNNAANASVGK